MVFDGNWAFTTFYSMSLVTQCPACGTMFKVVADQLRVSQGWVRCGNCSDVFDARVYVQNARVQTLDEALPKADESGLKLDEESPELQLAPDSKLARSATNGVAKTSPLNPSADPLLQTELADAPVTVDAQVDLPTSDLVVNETAAGEPKVCPVNDETVHPDFQNISFVKKARRKAFWQQSAVRVSLTVLAGVLVILFGLQGLVQHKDQIANAEPKLISLIQAVCQPLECQIQPLQRVESIVIDSASFTKLDEKSFRLSFVLKNTASATLQVPMLELTLSDNQDKAVLRRVLSPAQFGIRGGALLATRSETSGLVTFTVASGESGESPASAAMVAGYRVVVFYP